jgi:hypothetical protein
MEDQICEYASCEGWSRFISLVVWELNW